MSLFPKKCSFKVIFICNFIITSILVFGKWLKCTAEYTDTHLCKLKCFNDISIETCVIFKYICNYIFVMMKLQCSTFKIY